MDALLLRRLGQRGVEGRRRRAAQGVAVVRRAHLRTQPQLDHQHRWVRQRRRPGLLPSRRRADLRHAAQGRRHELGVSEGRRRGALAGEMGPHRARCLQRRIAVETPLQRFRPIPVRGRRPVAAHAVEHLVVAAATAPPGGRAGRSGLCHARLPRRAHRLGCRNRPNRLGIQASGVRGRNHQRRRDALPPRPRQHPGQARQAHRHGHQVRREVRSRAVHPVHRPAATGKGRGGGRCPRQGALERRRAARHHRIALHARRQGLLFRHDRRGVPRRGHGQGTVAQSAAETQYRARRHLRPQRLRRQSLPLAGQGLLQRQGNGLPQPPGWQGDLASAAAGLLGRLRAPDRPAGDRRCSLHRRRLAVRRQHRQRSRAANHGDRAGRHARPMPSRGGDHPVSLRHPLRDRVLRPRSQEDGLGRPLAPQCLCAGVHSGQRPALPHARSVRLLAGRPHPRLSRHGTASTGDRLRQGERGRTSRKGSAPSLAIPNPQSAIRPTGPSIGTTSSAAARRRRRWAWTSNRRGAAVGRQADTAGRGRRPGVRQSPGRQ